MTTEVIKFPIYTEVSPNPKTICTPINPNVFNYPFFDEGVEKLWDTKQGELKSELEELEPLQTNLLELKGFIYHTSHCGSTLLARMLNASPKVRVVSESEAINGLYIAKLLYNLPDNVIVDKLNRIINLFRQPIGSEKYLIIKMTSWNVFFRNFTEKLFPETAWLYLDRETELVVDSLMRSNKGMVSWWDHGADIFCNYFVGSKKQLASKKDYLFKLVNEHRRFANYPKNAKVSFLKYPEFISEFESTILKHFELSFSQEEIEKSMELLKYNSKSMKQEKYLKAT